MTLIISSSVTHAEVASLCDAHERVIWSCQARSKIYSVCASQQLTASTGYMQYRAGTPQDIELRFPGEWLHPKGYFEFNVLARGASLAFTNGGYTYWILEHLMDGNSIQVERANQLLATITCQAGTNTLTLTDTINLFDTLGITR